MENNNVKKQRQNRRCRNHMKGLMARVTKEGITVESYVPSNNLLPILEYVTNHIFKTILKCAEIPQGEITVKMLQAFSNGIATAVDASKKNEKQKAKPSVVVLSDIKELEELFNELMGEGK